MKKGSSIGKRILETICIPLIVFVIIWCICESKGIVLFATNGNWIAFFRSTATVMLTTFALSINLNSGRFDFSIGSIALLSSVISATICNHAGLPVFVMLLISLLMGMILGLISGGIYIVTKMPPIIVSLGVTLLYEGTAFAVTDGYGVSFVTNTELTSFPGVRNYILLIVIPLILMIIVYDHTKFGYEYKALLSGQEIAVHAGIHEIPNTIGCYVIAGGLMGLVGFMSSTNTGTIQMSLNFGSIGVMFTAFLPMFIGGFISRFCNEKIGYLLGAVSTAFISLSYARLKVPSSVQQIITAVILVGFLIYLNNENKLIEMKIIRKHRENREKETEKEQG